MAEAKRDGNFVTTLLGVSSSDGVTPVVLWADETTHRLLVSATSTVTSVIWSEVTGTTQAAAVNRAYVVNNAALVTVTLPDTAAVGDIVRVIGKGAGGWLIAQNASENINFGTVTTTTGVGGSLASSHRYDCVELVCSVANTTWTVISSVGNITYV